MTMTRKEIVDLVRTKRVGDDFDINGVTYRIVIVRHNSLERLALREQYSAHQMCIRCVTGGPHTCTGERTTRACRHIGSIPVGSRHVVPVSEVPILAVKGLLA